MPYTYVLIEVSKATFDEIEKKLRDAGYEHAIDDDSGMLDMHGLALVLNGALADGDSIDEKS